MYYIYCHVDPKDNSIFYIGKGKNGRAWCLNGRNNHHLNKLKKLQREGYKIKSDVVQFIEIDIKSQDEAYIKEVYYIAQFKQHHNLLNITPGGIGNSGKCGVTHPNWVTVDQSAVIEYLKQGLTIREIGNKLKCSMGMIKKKCYLNSRLPAFCKTNNITYNNHMAKHITEEEFQLQLKQRKSNKDIAKYFNVCLNYFKRKYYPNISIAKYCSINNIPYTKPQVGSSNGNYKEIDYDMFVNLVRQNEKLKNIAIHLGVSMRALIKKYKEKYKVEGWLELKRNLQL